MKKKKTKGNYNQKMNLKIPKKDIVDTYLSEADSLKSFGPVNFFSFHLSILSRLFLT